MQINELDVVLLKDGREATIVEKFSDTNFLADVGSDSTDWDTIPLTLDPIEQVVYKYKAQF